MAEDKRPSRHARAIRGFALEREVEHLLRDGKYGLAVLVSQTLLEVRTEVELAHFVETCDERALGEAALALLPSYNLANPRVQTFVERIVGVRFRDHCTDDFQALKAHTTRRNAIAHRGDETNQEEARASLTAVRTMSQTLHELCYRALGLDDDLEEEARQEREANGEEDEDWG